MNDRDQKEDVDDDDGDDGEGEEDHGLSVIHPTEVVLVFLSVDNIWNTDQCRHQPTKSHQPCDPELFFDEGLNSDHPEEGSLAQHPEVGGEHEVGGDHVQHAAPDRALGPDARVKQHQDIPQQPGDVVQGHAQEQIHMDPVSATSQ